MTRPRVVVVGSGFGGIHAVRGLRDAPVDVVVVDRDNYHGFWPLLYQVATGGLAAEDIAHPIRSLFSGQDNADIRLGMVAALDAGRRQLILEGQDPIGYDYLVLAAGSATATFGVDGVAEHAHPLKTVPDALRLRNHLLTRFERADADPSMVRAHGLDVVVVGGGPTGVEVAGAVTELVQRDLSREYRHLEPSAVHVTLVEMRDEVLTEFSSRSRARARKALMARGVQLRLGTPIAAVRAGGVDLADGTTVEAGTVVWAAGVTPNPLAQRLGLPLAEDGGVQVGDDLSVPGHPEIFVIGDLATTRERLPRLAPVAIQGGRHAAVSITRRLEGKEPTRFRYRDKGTMATIGRRAAVAELPLRIRLAGTLGWLAWLGVHLVFLIGFRRRILVLVNWAWNYVTWENGNRAIVTEDVHSPSGPERA